ncbi:chlorophyll a/b-binding protein [Halomicronema sp. CCY15110]|uniref:chlorophyll a/b-binding protein n=1 Tax=Halomicronema sp. CCY15110 TaxID=2767773 RepID=UPI001951E6D1|nr:chlorophyll a/b-binding protein [Halomicronema sp. CCY15110]
MTNLEPTVTPTIARPKAGFTTYAEKLNGRAAMLGFVAIVAIEYLTGKGIMTWLGLA